MRIGKRAQPDQPAAAHDTWTGAEATADPGVTEPGSEISARDKGEMAKQEQNHRHRMQPRVAMGVGVMTILLLGLALSFTAAHAINEQTLADIIHTLIAPLVVSGVIVIVAGLFRSK